MTDCEKCKKSVDTEVKYGKTDSGKLYHFECIPKEPAKPEEKKNPAEAENPPAEISITNRGITATGSDNSEVEKQQDKVIDQTYEVVGEDKIPRLAYTDRPKRHVLRTRIGFKGVTKDEVEKLKEKLKWYGATPNPPDEFENPPSAFSADTDKWYDDAIELETGREGENANLIALLNDKANKEILTFVIQALEKRYDSWSKSALAQARKIQDNGYKSEFRYQYGGTSLTGGKVSATSAFFSALQQALTYNTNPPTKENPVEIVLDATNPDREAIQKAYPEASMTDAVEFVLYAENDADLYRQRLQPWTVNFGRKMAAGKFDRKLAVGALADYLAKEVQTKYFKEMGSGGQAPEMTKATKMAFGELMLDSMMEEIQGVADDIKTGKRNKLGHKKGENPPSDAGKRPPRPTPAPAAENPRKKKVDLGGSIVPVESIPDPSPRFHGKSLVRCVECERKVTMEINSKYSPVEYANRRVAICRVHGAMLKAFLVTNIEQYGKRMLGSLPDIQLFAPFFLDAATLRERLSRTPRYEDIPHDEKPIPDNIVTDVVELYKTCLATDKWDTWDEAVNRILYPEPPKTLDRVLLAKALQENPPIEVPVIDGSKSEADREVVDLEENGAEAKLNPMPVDPNQCGRCFKPVDASQRYLQGETSGTKFHIECDPRKAKENPPDAKKCGVCGDVVQ